MRLIAGLLDAQTAALIIAACISPLVGLITKWHAPSWLKSALNLGLTTLGAVIATANFTDGASWKAYVVLIAQAWAVSLAMHFGFYRPTSASKAGWFQTPGTKTGDAGVKAPPLPHQRRAAATKRVPA